MRRWWAQRVANWRAVWGDDAVDPFALGTDGVWPTTPPPAARHFLRRRS